MIKYKQTLRLLGLAWLVILASCADSNPIDPIDPELIVGDYELVTYDGDALPVVRNPSAPDIVTTRGWFRFDADQTCEYGFDVQDLRTDDVTSLEFPCSYVTDGSSVSIQIAGETDFDLTGSWTPSTLELTDPVGSVLVYTR